MKAKMASDVSKFLAQVPIAGKRANQLAVEEIKQAVENIMQASLAEVPRDTEALASSIYTDVKENKNQVEGVVGYGAGDPINPKSLQPVSSYALTVHEDLSKTHEVGKAKFLEDPIRAEMAKLPARYGRKLQTDLSDVFGGK